MQRAIDVSKWNGDIDYTGVKSIGINNVIIQCGYGMESNQKDPYFDKNYRKAKYGIIRSIIIIGYLVSIICFQGCN